VGSRNSSESLSQAESGRLKGRRITEVGVAHNRSVNRPCLYHRSALVKRRCAHLPGAGLLGVCGERVGLARRAEGSDRNLNIAYVPIICRKWGLLKKKSHAGSIAAKDHGVSSS
jgi:hypothetical protein